MIPALATRICDTTGHWWVKPDLNTTWTNLTRCTSTVTPDDGYGDVPEIIEVSHLRWPMKKIWLCY